MRMVFDDLVFEVDERELNEIFGEYLNKLGNRIANESKLNLLRNKSFVTGFLHDNVTVEEAQFGVGAFEALFEVKVIFKAEYGDYVEFGTMPHPVSKKGIENLTKWAATKFGLPEKEASRRAYSIAAGIKKRGTRPKPFVRPTIELLVSGNLPGGEN